MDCEAALAADKARVSTTEGPVRTVHNSMMPRDNRAQAGSRDFRPGLAFGNQTYCVADADFAGARDCSINARIIFV